jgi:hypothetical protein
MVDSRTSLGLLSSVILGTALIAGCSSGAGGGIGDLFNVNDNATGGDNVNANTPGGPLLGLETVATETGGASGMALRPSDGALFAVNPDGLFGPIAEGADLSGMTPIGATNLADADIFDAEQKSLVLAISNADEFWIGSQCCVTLAVVAPTGGAAEAYTGLLTGPDPGDPSNIKPETMVIVPANFDGPQIDPGNLLVGRETAFSELSAIDVEGDRSVVNVDNPDELENPNDFLIRVAHHLTFGPDGTLYASRGVPSAEQAGIQTIDPDGRPHDLPGTQGLSAHSFVVLGNGDLLIRGSYQPAGGSRVSGLLIWSGETYALEVGLALPDADLSEDDELVIAPEGTIYLSLPERNQIVRVIDLR